MNKENNNDVYYEDNSFNNQGMDTSEREPTAGETLGNALNSGMNFAKGITNMKNNPALGLKKPKENNKESDKKGSNNQDNKNNNDPAKGQKKGNEDNKDNENNNQMPGSKKNQDNKTSNSQNNINNNKKSENNNTVNKNKQGGNVSKSNSINKTAAPKMGGAKKSAGKAAGNAASNLGKAAINGLKAFWTALPPQGKLIAVGIAVVPIIIIAFIGFLSLLSSTVAATTAAVMCGSDSSGFSYNGETYSGSADAIEFLCQAQAPLGGAKYTTTSRVKWRWGRQHQGIDLGIPVGTPIYAVQAGTVEFAGDYGGGGQTIIIDHGSGIKTLYMHQSYNGFKVKKGDKVGKGQRIGTSGNTGRSTGPHLHYQLNINGKHSDALNAYFPKENQSGTGTLEDFKRSCGNKWNGELAGDSANAANDTTDYVASDSSESSECCESDIESSQPVEGLPKVITQEFVDAAVSTQTKYKVPASLTLSQLILESGAYSNSLSELAVKCKNLFGVKGNGPAGSCRYQTSEQTSSGNSYNIYANFAKYNTYQESFDARGKLLTGPIYEKCVKDAKTGDEWAHAIKKCGYATDVKYPEKLISLMKKYDLYKYDDYTSSDQCQTSFDGKIVFYDQTDYPNVKFCSGGCTVADSGCGATAMAIILSSLLEKEITPVEMAKFCCSRKLCGCDGSGNDFFQAAAKDYGVKIKKVSRDNKEEVLTALNRKQGLVIALMGPGKFTNGGHFITLTGIKGEQVFVHDPNNGDKRGTNKYWDFDFIVKQTRQDINNVFWIISR